MRGEILFEKMTDISEKYITEAALVPAVGASPAKKPENRFAALSSALNSGWGVACICFIVAIAAVVGMVAWGRMGTAGPGSDPNTQFTFSYSMTPINGKVNRGDTVTVDASMTNQGKAFTTSDFFPYAQFILQGNDSVVIQGVYALDESTEKRKIENGDQASRYFIFSIPENAVEGTYDLVISYKKEQQVYSGVLEVDTDHTAPEYSFGYKPVKQFYHIGETVTMEAWVINNREFLYKGELYGFKPTPACLEHRQSGYRIQGITTAWDGYTTTIIPAGTKGMAEYQFSLLTGVPTGEYDLILTYKDCEQRFEQVLTVGESTSETDYPPVDITDHPFSFGYELAGDALTGATYLMDTWVINEGEAFTYEGASMGFAPTASLIHMETQYRIDGSFGMDDDHGVFTVNPGDIGRVTQEFFIPADAPTGAYALKLSYGGVSESFPGVVIVAEPTDVDLDYPLPEDGHPFSFGYEPFEGFAIPGDWLTVKAWVINEGEPFSFFGDPNSFEPVATLHHVDSGYVIQGHSAPTGIPPKPCNVLTGQKGESAYTFPIPADAPTGVYRLKLSYGGAQETFDNVLTVAVPTVPALGDMENPSFSFDYELLNSPDPAYAAWKAGDTIRIKVSVTNQGAPFTYTGSSGDFIPYPELYLKTVDNTRLTLHGTTPLPEDTGTFTVSTGQTGTAVYKFVLPDDIPAGYLEFAMSYAGKGTGKYSFGYISNASYTKEEAIAFATKQLSERHPELDLSQYVPRCVDSLGAGFDYKVQFQYQYYGYTVIGGKTVTVSLAADKKLLGIETEDEYAAYMEVLTENVFLATIQNIRNSILEIDQAADPTEIMENLLSFQIDAEGYLCLTMEYIGPPRYDENGNNLSGCIDHEHYFFTERLCSKP